MNDAPEFLLLDTTGPRPGALLLSFSFLSVLLVLSAVLPRPISATPPSRGEMVAEIFPARGPLWLPTSVAGRNSRQNVTPTSQPDPPAPHSHPLPEATARPDPPAAVQRGLQAKASPLASRDVLSAALELQAAMAGATQVAAGDALKPTPDALGTLMLQQLIENEPALAASLAALPPARRLALPHLSIRVDAEWLKVLPQTKEELYFSVTKPQEDSEVLAYSPDAHSFTWKRPQQPFWQIREGEQVPALAALRSAAASVLGVSPELVGLYTWHPPVLENALRMFVLAQMEHLGVQLGPRDVVTVRFASGPEGCLMSLEPIRAEGSP